MSTTSQQDLTALENTTFLFRRGDVWNEGLQRLKLERDVTIKGLTFGAYGTGSASPLWSGAATVLDSAWIQSGAIWRAPLSSIAQIRDGVFNLWAGNQYMTRARSPNAVYSGSKVQDYWFNISQVISGSSSSIKTTDPFVVQRAQNSLLKGAIAYVHETQFKFSEYTVIDSSVAGNEAILNLSGNIYPSSNEFFLKNHTNVLDAAGEWDVEDAYVSYIPLGGERPSNITLCIREYGFRITSGFNYYYNSSNTLGGLQGVVFKDIKLDRFQVGYYMDTAFYGGVYRSSFTNMELLGISAKRSLGFTVENNVLENIQGNGINFEGQYHNNVTIQRNTINNVGLVIGAGGGNLTSNADGIKVSAPYSVVSYNVISNTARLSSSVMVTNPSTLERECLRPLPTSTTKSHPRLSARM